MTKEAGLTQEFFIQGYEIPNDIGAVNSAGSPRNTFEMTGLDKPATERVMGRVDGFIDLLLWFNDATNQLHDALKGLPTTDVHILWGTGGSLSDSAAFLVAKQLNYDWREEPDRALSGNLRAEVNGSPLEWGSMLTAGSVTHSSASSETGEVDAQTSTGIVGFLEIMTIASGSPTFVIQDSSDTTNGIDGSWSTVLTFTENTARKGERVTATGTIEKGLRATTTGSFSDAVFAMAFRRGLAEDDVDLS